MTGAAEGAASRPLDEAPAVVAFRRCFESGGEVDDLDRWLDDDVWLAPPTYLKPWRGRPAVSRLIGHAASNLADFRYERVWCAEDSVVLMFEATVDGRSLRGVDILFLDDAGRIAGVEIAARPPKAVLALSERMGASLASDPFFGAEPDRG